MIVCDGREGCGRKWTATREAHCAGCHRHFSSDSAFSLHQRLDHGPCAERRENQGADRHRVCYAVSVCRDPATLRKGDGSPRLVEVETRWGPVWAQPGARPPGSFERAVDTPDSVLEELQERSSGDPRGAAESDRVSRPEDAGSGVGR